MKSYQALKRLFSITMVLCLCLTVLAIPGKKKEQKSKGDVGTTISLVTTGSGDTKDEATKMRCEMRLSRLMALSYLLILK